MSDGYCKHDVPQGDMGGCRFCNADPRDRLVELWRQEVALGTTQGGGRRYEEHCALHREAIELLAQIDEARP